MELFDHYFNFIMDEINSGGLRITVSELIDIHQSLKRAVDCGQYMELYNGDDFCGFLTWEIRPNEIDKTKIDLGIANLFILKRSRGTYPLQRATNELRRRYPNIGTFIWHDRKKQKMIVRKQGCKNAIIQAAL